MSSGVRNLRAMFENKDPADVPDRGRSPAASSMGEQFHIRNFLDKADTLQAVLAMAHPLDHCRQSGRVLWQLKGAGSWDWD